MFKTYTDPNFGFAMYLACDYAQTLEYKREHSPEAYKDALAMPDLAIIADYAPMLHCEQEDGNDDEVLKLMQFSQDMEDAQTNLFEPAEFVELCKTFFDMVRKGEFKCICAIQETLYRLPEDSDIEVGGLIDPDFLLTFHQRMSEAKNAKVWRSGSFLAVADFVY